MKNLFVLLWVFVGFISPSLKNAYTGDIIYPVDTIVLKKGWFTAYNMYIKNELNNSKYLLEYNKSFKYWIDFIKALSYAESKHDPIAMFHEVDINNGIGMGGKKRLAQGLLQLSYEDIRRYGCDFDFNLDKKRANTDHSKTIFNPKNNLSCGVKILNYAVKRYGKPIFNNNQYFGTLMPRKSKGFRRFNLAFNKYQME